MNLFEDIYRGRRVLLTGHTGFKGSWLALWLSNLGANIAGVSLDPETQPSHWDILNLSIEDHRQDIRDAGALAKVVAEFSPEIVFHLAAQPLVRRSYRSPLETFATNVMGTAHVLDACRQVQSVRAIVVITTDKCYENQEWPWGYREIDRLGGHDPYSASKAAAELVAASYRDAFFDDSGPLIATARAGNVIGGGDWSEDRLIPDAARAVAAGEALTIRSPHSTRPWQHVLESLHGYLLLGQKLLDGQNAFSTAWNFGPDSSGNAEVDAVLKSLTEHWPELGWQVDSTTHPHEARLLYLDSSKARQELGWVPVWPLPVALKKTAEWYRAFYRDGEVRSQPHLDEYVADLQLHGGIS